MVLKLLLKIIFLVLFFNCTYAVEAPVIKPNSLRKSKKIRANIFFTLGYLSFQNKTKIKTPLTSYNDLNYTSSGLILGYKEATDFKTIRLGGHVSFFYGNTDAKSDTVDIFYFKRQIVTYGAMTGLSFLFSYDREKKFFFGPELDLSYFYTKWPIPSTDGQLWSIEETSKVNGVISLAGEYSYKSYIFYHKFGYPIKGSSFIWNLGLGLKI